MIYFIVIDFSSFDCLGVAIEYFISSRHDFCDVIIFKLQNVLMLFYVSNEVF